MDDEVTASLQDANEFLSDVRLFKDQGLSSKTAVNCLYYACFHATKAVLHDRGHDPNTHSGVKSLLGEELVLTGEVSRDDDRFFREMQKRRERADYEHHPVSADVDGLIQCTTEFVQSMEELMAESNENGH